MENSGYESIRIETVVHAPLDQVWRCWTEPGHIMRWNSASEDWHTPSAENDLRQGGRLNWRMEARDGSLGFDFAGTYDEVKEKEKIAYTLDDGRRVEVTFRAEGEKTRVIEVFEAEPSISSEMQRAGWQAILDRFRMHTESEGQDSTLAP